ncbi:ANTAR domain-containing protein [Amycolatopsis rhabdoformis]|uniref:ANTAR domain-containing protein n=1 Tax=Amycolatopsis rhabdoformis TaxID=1448059 RepID=A0ABZ1IHM9_9PSEU|nr:ANTAR domain-containing protein [Amycolatopsis rhabdoformis]WSE33621.1 ANTAR domain-containing protein [Amycolatopsis rhabdoformis]
MHDDDDDGAENWGNVMSAAEVHDREGAPAPRRAPGGGTERHVGELLVEIEQLRTALHHRGVIERAKGVLMGQRGCGPDEAFALLTKVSQETNTKLRDVAAELLDAFTAGLPGNASTSSGSRPVPRKSRQESR